MNAMKLNGCTVEAGNAYQQRLVNLSADRVPSPPLYAILTANVCRRYFVLCFVLIIALNFFLNMADVCNSYLRITINGAVRIDDGTVIQNYMRPKVVYVCTPQYKQSNRKKISLMYNFYTNYI